MPFESDRAVSFLNQVRKILEFQSTIDILKGMHLHGMNVRAQANDSPRPPFGIYYAVHGHHGRNRYNLGQGQEQQLFQSI
jgi:hypothetical protein